MSRLLAWCPDRTRAVLWLNDAGHTPVDFGTLPGVTDSTAVAVNDASGADWVIQAVTAINSHGQIVGFGRHQGVPGAFVMTRP